MKASSSNDDIAIIGLSCRFPGDAVSPGAFFDMLLRGRSAWSLTPKDRFDAEAFYHPSFARQGTCVVRGGHFLKEDVGLFDAPVASVRNSNQVSFFSLSILVSMTQGEAAAMDPQQRLLLEVAYESIENAGLPMESLIGSDAGCFIGGFTKDYDLISTRDISDTLLYSATGNGLGMLSNRLSWFYDIRGPSMTVDTACSSSLVALHLACQAIRVPGNESRTALVGGVGLILSPDQIVSANSLHFFSPDSRCFSFDERANGYARGEGASVMVLKHIDDAIRDGDTVRAIIRGSGVNQDGKTPGITLPSSEAQASLIRSTYQAAGLDFSQTRYFEAHGTGTAAGDPLEMMAIASTFGQESNDPTRPLYVGTVKPNIGHLEGCAGMAGIVKTVLSLEAGIIPPNLNFKVPNPKLKLKEWNIQIPTECTLWPQDGLRRASVNSFGYGGTNAHVILDDAWHYLKLRNLSGHTSTVSTIPSLPTDVDSEHSCPPSNSASSSNEPIISRSASSIEGNPSRSTWASSTSVDQHGPRPQYRIYLFSAPDQGAVKRSMLEYSSFLNRQVFESEFDNDVLMRDLAHTLGQRRSKFQWRSVVVSSSTKDLATVLTSAHPSRPAETPRVVWIFTGQGAQWFAMGRELLSYDVFKTSILDSDKYLTIIGADWSVYDELGASERSSRINDARFSQPLCAVLQIALIDLMRHWGLSPAAVVGHSSGEIAAAYALGALSAHDSLKIAFHRGRLAESVALVAPHLSGSMLNVGLSEQDVRPYLTLLGPEDVVVIGCVNSPTNVTLSGDTTALEKIEDALKQTEVFVRKLQVDNAYHSPHMKVISDTYLDSIRDISPVQSTGDTVMYSSVTGREISSLDLGPSYWVENMTSPVQFVKALENLSGSSTKPTLNRRLQNIIVEVGPHRALQGPIKQFLKKQKDLEGTHYCSVLHRGEDAVKTSLEAMAVLLSKGLSLDLPRLNSFWKESTTPKVLTKLPCYPWYHRKRYWHQSSQERSHLFPTAPRLDWLGAPMEDFNPLEPRWKNTLRISELPWLEDHKMDTNIIYPGAGMLCCALEAARQVADPTRIVENFELRDITIGKALLIPEGDRGVEIFTHLKPRKTGMLAKDAPWFEYTFYSLKEDGGHIEHSSGLITIEYKNDDETVRYQNYTSEAQILKEEYERFLNECTVEMSSEAIYTELAARGMNFGPTFQNLSDVRIGYEKACVTITISDTKAVMPSNFEFEHLLHPTTLDACFHALLPATHQTNKGSHSVAVPIEIARISISADLPRGSGKKLCGFVTSKRTGFRETDASIMMSEPDFKKPMISVVGLHCQELGGMIGLIDESGDSKARKICSEIVYRDDINLLQQSHAQETFQQHLEDPDELDTFITSAQRAAVIFMRQALKGLTPKVEAALPPHLVHYVEWIRGRYSLAVQGLLRGQDSKDTWFSTGDSADRDFLSDFKNSCEDAKLLAAIGNNLSEIFEGSKSSLDVMMQDDMLSKTYAQAHGVVTGVQMIKDWFDLKAHKQPDMKILEVGAGTGSITLPIMQILKPRYESSPRFGSYVFTDISSGFFEPARELLKEWQGLIKFGRLDIEKDPVEQGFEANSFDVIAASNVLHATSDISMTLRNCYALLKPGGKLILGEITQPAEYMSLIYGTLPGWWSSKDGRIGGPCLSADQWNSQLLEAKFSGLDIIVRDSPRLRNHIISMMVSTKSDPQRETYDEIIILTPPAPSKDVDKIIQTLSESFPDTKLETETLRSVITTNDRRPKCTGKFIISLLEIEEPLLFNLSEQDFYNVKQAIQYSSGILWVTCGNEALDPFLRPVSGLFRVVKSENPQLRLHELHLSRTPDPQPDDIAGHIVCTFDSILAGNPEDAETEIVETNGRLRIPRLVDEVYMNQEIHACSSKPVSKLQPLFQPGRPLALVASVPGMLESLHFVDDLSYAQPLSENEMEVEVQANSLNYKDVMIAMGYVKDTMIGSDAAGVVTSIGSGVTRFNVGDRVAVIQKGAMRTTLRVDASIPQRIPENLSMEEGASLPTIYATAYHAMIEVARLQKGESVLIHRASGGLGQALIQIAQQIGAEIFATAGTIEKRNLLVREYGIPTSNIFNSRDLIFAKGVMQMTSGKGVDVIFNSLAGESLRKNWDCIAEFGRFIELGMRDILANSGLDMRPFSKSLTFATVNVDHILRRSVPKAAHLMKNVFDLVRKGTVKVVTPLNVIDYTDLEHVFRTMHEGNTVGKTVFRVTNESMVQALPAERNVLQLDPMGTYILVGGLGGLGRGIAIYLAENGAKNIAFISRSADSNAASQETLERLNAKGVRYTRHSCDVADAVKLELVIDEIKVSMPTIKGVIQAAMVLKDSIFENMNYESWITATRPKIQGSWNLHTFMPKELDFFIMLSSATGIIGNRGQANYCAGNTFQDALAHYRRSRGLPGTALDLGAIRGIGWVAENNDSEVLKAMDRILVDSEDLYAVLKSAMTGFSDGQHRLPTQVVMAAGTGADDLVIRQSGASHSLWWLQDPKFAYLRRLDLESKTTLIPSSRIDYKALLLATTSLAEATQLVQEAVVSKLATSMDISKGDIEVSKPVHHYGVDSLVAIDLRNWIFRELRSAVTVFDILNSVPLASLAEIITRNSEIVAGRFKEEL